MISLIRMRNNGLSRAGGCLRAARSLVRKRIECVLPMCALALGIVLPLMGERPTFLLDWITGPRPGGATEALLGLNSGLETGIVDVLGKAALAQVFGGSVTWLLILVIFVVAAVGVGHLVGGPRWARLPAATLYTVNPFVFNRLYVGHLPLLLGYALLPLAVASAVRAPTRRGTAFLGPAVWWAVLTALSPHFAWIYGLVVLVAFLLARPSNWRNLARLGATCAGFALTSLYILLPHSASRLPATVGTTSLALYRTTADPHFGLLFNVLGLYGFWRLGPGPELPKQVVTGWPLLLLALLAVVATGAVWRLRGPMAGSQGADSAANMCAPLPSPVSDADGDPGALRHLALVLVVTGLAGYFLALGDQGPTGPIFHWAYFHVPFFQVMREPQKFLMLTALAYSVLYGWGVERLSHARALQSRTSTAIGILGVALPLMYCPTIFWGLAGQISPSTLPRAYQQADRLMGNGQGKILYLPWHLYMSYPFTGNRVVANIGPSSFRRDVISGDNVEAQGVATQSTLPRSAYIGHLLSDGERLCSFGAVVAPLGVEYVVLAKTVDWADYRWLGHQSDLRRVLDSSSLEVWRNLDYGGIGQRMDQPQTVPSVTALVARAQGKSAAGGPDAGTVRVSHALSAPPKRRGGLVREISPVAYRVPPGRPGWVTVDTAYQSGWYLDGRPAVRTPEGTTMFPVGAAGGVAKFEPWGTVKLGYALSATTFALLVAALLLGRRWATRPLERREAPVGDISP